MRRTHLLLASTALLVVSMSLLVVNWGCSCDGGGAPPRSECSSPDTSVDIDSITLDARFESGGQGLAMVVFDVTYRGTTPPSCAAISYVLRSTRAGGVETGTVNLQTHGSSGMATTRLPHWVIWDAYADEVDVQITTYGQTALQHICQFPCGEDAGT